MFLIVSYVSDLKPQDTSPKRLVILCVQYVFRLQRDFLLHCVYLVMQWCKQGVRVRLVGVQQIQNDKNNLSDTVTPPALDSPNSILYAPVFTAVMAAGKEVRAALCYHGNLFWSGWVHDFIMNEIVSHEFNKEVDGKKDESFVAYTDGPLRSSLRIVQIFFKSSWDFLGTLKENMKTVLLKGEKSTIQMKTIKKKKEMNNRYN